MENLRRVAELTNDQFGWTDLASIHMDHDGSFFVDGDALLAEQEDDHNCVLISRVGGVYHGKATQPRRYLPGQGMSSVAIRLHQFERPA